MDNKLYRLLTVYVEKGGIALEGLYEVFVLNFLTRDGKTFAAPQYDIDNGYSCPDFVALRPSEKKVIVVEVSTAYDLTRLADKLRNKNAHWFERLTKLLVERRVVDASWDYEIMVFVRRNRINWLREKLGEDVANVRVCAIEDTVSTWDIGG
jgi:Holliday junction resolvase-like predicted endonuclease